MLDPRGDQIGAEVRYADALVLRIPGLSLLGVLHNDMSAASVHNSGLVQVHLLQCQLPLRTSIRCRKIPTSKSPDRCYDGLATMRAEGRHSGEGARVLLWKIGGYAR